MLLGSSEQYAILLEEVKIPYSGGIYSAPSSPGAFNQAVTGSPATPAAFNALLTDIATALSTCMLADGTQIITANIPMNLHKFTGMTAGTAADDSAIVFQTQTGAASYVGTPGGTGDAITLTLSPAIVSYTAGIRITFKVASPNSGSPTVNVNGLGAIPVTWANAAPLVAADLVTNAIVTIAYNSTLNTFHLLTVTRPTPALRGSKTYDPASLLTGTQAQTTVTVTSAVLGNFAMAAFSLDLQGITLSATVSAVNTVTVTFRNDTGGTLDIGSGTLSAAILS